MRLDRGTSAAIAPALAASSKPESHGLASRSVDSTLFTEMHWMAQYAAAAYCNNDGTVGAVVTCEDSVCANVTSNGATIVTTLSGDWESTGGVIIKDDVRSAIVVAFTGTDSTVDDLLDIDVLSESIGMCDGCKVHSGFHGAWDAMADTVLDTLQDVVASYSDYSVTFTGHSLGAAIATLGCAYWRIDGGSCDLYTYGSPRVGNLDFAEFVSAQTGNEYRVTHLLDPVPRLPSHYFGYYHTNMEYWLSDGTDTTVDYTESDVVICTGYYNTSCNSQGIITTDLTAHSYYLEHISVCS